MMMRLQLEKSDAESKHAIRGFRGIGVVLPTGKQVCFHETGRFAYVPTTGFGTAVYPFVSFKTMKESILYAIKLGYRHFDSAALYQSEQSLGEAIVDAIRLGFIKSHKELFITSKLWCFDAHHDHALPAIRKSLKNFFPWISSLFGKPWRSVSLGLTKSVGVSNFSCKKLQLLLSTAKIPPAVNQVGMNPLWQQKNLRDICEKNDIHVTAFSPLGAKGTSWGK
ncbi:unnamed protein product [Camellia sinensis]